MFKCVRFVDIILGPLVGDSVLGVFLGGCLGVLIVVVSRFVVSLYPLALHRSLPQQLTNVKLRDILIVCVVKFESIIYYLELYTMLTAHLLLFP